LRGRRLRSVSDLSAAISGTFSFRQPAIPISTASAIALTTNFVIQIRSLPGRATPSMSPEPARPDPHEALFQTIRVVWRPLTARQQERRGWRNSPHLVLEISIESPAEAKLAANRQSMTGLQHDSALMAREKPVALNLARWLRPDRSAHGV